MRLGCACQMKALLSLFLVEKTSHSHAKTIDVPAHTGSQTATPSLIKLTSFIICLFTQNVKSCKTLNAIAIQPLLPRWFICTVQLALIQQRVTRKGGKGWHNCCYDWCTVWLVLVLIQKSRQLFEPALYFAGFYSFWVMLPCHSTPSHDCLHCQPVDLMWSWQNYSISYSQRSEGCFRSKEKQCALKVQTFL